MSDLACPGPVAESKVIVLPQDPVITPDGYMYSKEAILENLLAQV